MNYLINFLTRYQTWNWRCLLIAFNHEKAFRDPGSNLMTIKEKHKDLKKKVNIAEEKRNIRRGQKSWYDLRTLKKLKLNMKDKLLKDKS